MQGAMPLDQWEQITQAVTSITPNLQARIDAIKADPPDPQRHPVTAALVAEYVARLESHVRAIHEGPEGIKRRFGDRPGDAISEMAELESWFIRKTRKPNVEFTRDAEDAIGNFFVSIGKSFTEARFMVDQIRKLLASKGAPHKRTETLTMMDARVSNGWSYKTLASKMCDCGAKKHTAYCAERIRKRLKELERFLAKYRIAYPGKKD